MIQFNVKHSVLHTWHMLLYMVQPFRSGRAVKDTGAAGLFKESLSGKQVLFWSDETSDCTYCMRAPQKSKTSRSPPVGRLQYKA